MTTLVERANRLFLQHLVGSPEGRVHLLTQVANAETSGELAIFERLAALADDADVQRLIRRHAADEVDHGARFNARIAELGVPRPTLPDSLNLALGLDRRLGVLTGPLETREDVMRAYCFLQVLEERVVWQFPLFVEVLTPVDPVTAQLFADIAKDEVRHLQYCEAISKRFAPSDEVRTATLAHFRAVEADAFVLNGQASLEFILSGRLLAVAEPVRAGWRVLGALSAFGRRLDPGVDDARFEHSDQPEPHRLRRRRLLAQHPQLTRFFGFDRRTIAVTLVVALAQVGLAALAARLGGWAMVGLAYGVGAIASHWLGQAIHETSHRLAARTPLANRALAWVANAPMVLPIAETFHRYHLEHHVHLGRTGRDSDLPLPVELDLIGTSRWRKLVWLALYPLVYFARGARSAKRPSMGEVANVLAMVLINVAVWKSLGPLALGYLALSTFFGHGLHPVAGHFIHEHYLFEGRQETNSYDGPLNLVTFNVGYHVEHHDFMNIPGWRLPAYRAALQGEYEAFASHRSWTLVLWNFVWRTDLGPASRLVRP